MKLQFNQVTFTLSNLESDAFKALKAYNIKPYKVNYLLSHTSDCRNARAYYKAIGLDLTGFECHHTESGYCVPVPAHLHQQIKHDVSYYKLTSAERKILAMLDNLKNNDGLTLKKYKAINYKTGYQVATEGVECANILEAFNAIQAYKGNCGVWYSEGIYYIDKSHRVATKKDALSIGRLHNQISVLQWTNMALLYC